jgi:predicted site-specific integrase-resolvase
LPNLAQAIGMPAVTLYQWAYRGWLRARRQEQPPQRWIIWADEQEMERLRERYQRPAGYYTRQRWVAEVANTGSM